MGKKQDDDGDVYVKDAPMFATCEEHGTTKYVGNFTGVLHKNPEGETVYEDKSSSSVGYSQLYASKWEANFGKKAAEEAN
jgi:hypothetical protein